MKRFGCIFPSVIHLPWDIDLVLPADLSASVVTLNVRNGRPGEHERALSIMRGAADVLVDENCGAIVAFGVPVSARRGFAAEQRELCELTADRGAVPIASSLAASAHAFTALGSRRPLLVTQYAPEVNEQLLAFYRDAGLAPAGAAGLGARNAAEVNALTPERFHDLARAAIGEHPSADGIFLSARGNLVDVASKLEGTVQLPVVDQVQAAVWWARSVLGASAATARLRLSSAPAQLPVTAS